MPELPRPITATDLRSALRTAEDWLATNRDGINAINVYPVPDGDTGTNMLLTLRAALRDAAAAPSPDPAYCGEYLAGVARAALLGARGNSGVILSQMLRGFAEALEGEAETNCAGVVRALTGASKVAYAAVSTPVEGTMLTVLREAASAGEAAERAGLASTDVMRAVVDEAFASVDRTPMLLPRLRDAGVVDSGGMGVAVILEGLACGLHGLPLPTTPRLAASEGVALEAVEHEGHGYCAEYVLSGADLDRTALERELVALGGESILVVGDARTLHVHVHLADPGPAISLGVAAGSLMSVKVDNMQAQHEAWVEGHEAEADPATLPAIGLVAVAQGAGIARAFRDLGATRVIAPAGGKASAAELLEAARGAGREHVMLLPNDKDVLMAAETAAHEAAGFVTVIPTRNVAAGLAAAVAYLPTGDPEEIAATMLETLEVVRSVEVTVAVRDALIDGVQVRTGDPIAFVEGMLVATAESVDAALLAGLARAAGEGAEIVTVYLGADVPAGSAERVQSMVQAVHPALEVEVVDGGQSHYHYVASVE